MIRLRDCFVVLRVIFGLLAGACLSGCQPKPATNVLVIVADDMGWGDLSLHGNPNIRTPHLDSLARSGIEFTDFYVSAICSPTRAELLTGRHALSLGVTGPEAGGERLDTSAVVLPEVLAKAGYRSGLFGKWHNGQQPPNHPLSRGFETFFGYTEGHWASYFDAPMLEDGEVYLRGSGYLPDQLTDRTIEWLARERTEPAFTVLSLPTPHSPMQVPDRWFDAVAKRPLDSLGNGQGEEDPAFTQAALAMVENIDWNVGRLLRALDSLGLRQNTLVVFMSDNGPNNWRWNAGMRGRKASVDEGGVRSPLFVSLLGRIDAGQTDASPLSVRDLFPTLCDFLGIAQDGKALDGRSFAERLTDPDATIADVPIVRAWREKTSVRLGRYLLDDEGHLYDLISDRGQHVDIREDFTSIADSLEQTRADFRFAIGERNAGGPRPFLVGHRSQRSTHLSAGEATVTRGVSPSNRYPNSRYLTDWRDTSAAVRWPVHVLRSGKYAVTIWYALDSTEANVEVQFRQEGSGGATAWTQVPVNAQPLLGASKDRVIRDEGYYKDWLPTDVGQLDLSEGPDTLALRCVVREANGVAVAAGSKGVELRGIEVRYLRAN